MSEVDPAVLEVPVREYAAFLQDFPFMPSDWITLCNALCQVDRGGSRDQLPFETRYYYHQRGDSPPSPALILISTETEGESGSFVSEMFIYATDLPKDMEKPLLQVMTVEPQNIIHFLSFNLVVSMGKFFWSPHPAVKHDHYSIMRELYLREFWGCRPQRIYVGKSWESPLFLNISALFLFLIKNTNMKETELWHGAWIWCSVKTLGASFSDRDQD